MKVARLLLPLALLSAQACSRDQPRRTPNDPPDAQTVDERPDAAAAARFDAGAPYNRPEPPGPCDQPDGPCRTPCNLNKSPLCAGTQVCVIGCEYGVVAQYCREPDPSALALGEMCMFGKVSCRAGGCMQEPRPTDGPRCTALCVVDEDCPADTHCVASTFSYVCGEAGQQIFKEGLCRSLSVAGTPP